MKTAVLLDAGGILLDESAMEKEFCTFTVAELSKIVDGYTEEQYWQDVAESVTAFAPRTRPYVFWKYLRDDPAAYHRIYTVFRKKIDAADRKLVLMPGIVPELEQLYDEFELIQAGQYGAATYELFKQHGIDGLFKNRLSQDDFSITKPDPRYLLQIADAAGVAPEQCVMVGDRIDKDVVPAKQCGMGTVLVKSGIYKDQQPRDPEEVPDIVLDSVVGMADAIFTKWRS